MVSHRGTAALSAHPYTPRDKSKVNVQVVQRWIVALLSDRQFSEGWSLSGSGITA